MLMHEILLTRICALRLFFHFAFLIISNCLLGMGASGTLLTLYQDSWKKRQRPVLTVLSATYLASLIIAYALLLTYPLPQAPDLERFDHLLSFSIFNLIGALPFFFGGTVIGMLLTFNPERVNRLYAVDLMGAGLGCFVTPALLAAFGAGGVFIVTVLLALAASVALAWRRWGMKVVAVGAVAGACGVWLLPTLDHRIPVPSKGIGDLLLRLQIENADVRPFTSWSSNSRIDLVKPPAGTRGFIFTRGSKTQGLPPIPEQQHILQDANAGTTIVNFSQHPEGLEVIRRSMYSAAIQLKERPSVFIIGLGGANDAWAAKANGALRVKAVELNAPILEIHRRILPHYSRALLDDPTIEFVVGEGRSALMRETEFYDVIQMTGIDTWTALASGAYVLAENYLYTEEAIRSMYQRLADGGILQIIRFAADMETLRMLVNVYAALDGLAVPDPSQSLMVLGTGDELRAILLKKGVFSAREQHRMRRFAEENGIQTVYLPNGSQNNTVKTFIQATDKQSFIERFPRDISPTTDDRPYFFNFFKWRNPLASRAYLAEPTTVSQGNPIFILSHLALSIVLSGALILLPLARRKGIPRASAGRHLLYFAGLGFGFIAIEISAIQKLTLFLGHPVYSLTVTLFAMLVFTGLGSLTLADRFGTADRRIWIVPGALAVLIAGFIVVSPVLANELIGLPLPARVAITVGLLAPMCLLLGVPFAYGIRVLNQLNPTLLPWAWAVNGCASVVGSVMTVVVSMNFGFNAVLWSAALIYLLAFWSLRRQITLASAPGLVASPNS
jgi:hypothetical protein